MAHVGEEGALGAVSHLRGGGGLFQSNAGLAALYDGLKPPSLARFGETDDRTDELI